MGTTKTRSSYAAKRVVGLVLAVVIVGIGVCLPASESLSHAGIMSLTILFACVALWFCETFPAGVTGLFGGILLLLFGATGTFSEAFSGFTSSTVWFIFAVFCLTAVMMKSTLGKRLTRSLIKWAGADSRKLVFAFMVGAALISTVMTDTGAVVVSMSLALPLLHVLKAQPGHSNLGKCLMIGIPFAAVLGGFSTPVGHSLNVLGLGILQTQTGMSVNFLQWMAVGVPICLIMLPVCWFFLVKAFNPEPITAQDVEIVLQGDERPGPWSAHDKKSLAMLIVLPVFWVLGNWIEVLNPTTVIILGLVVMFLPGVNILTWDDFQENVGWNVFLMIGGVMCLGNAVQSSGAGDFLAALFLGSGIMNIDPFWALLCITAAMYLIHTFCPIAPALCALFLPPLIAYAQAVGISPALPVFLVASITAGNFLVPLNPTIIVTYGKGYYGFGEVAKAGWVSSLVYVVVAVVWVYSIGGALLA